MSWWETLTFLWRPGVFVWEMGVCNWLIELQESRKREWMLLIKRTNDWIDWMNESPRILHYILHTHTHSNRHEHTHRERIASKTYLSLKETKGTQIIGDRQWDWFIQIGTRTNNGNAYDFHCCWLLIDWLIDWLNWNEFYWIDRVVNVPNETWFDSCCGWLVGWWRWRIMVKNELR